MCAKIRLQYNDFIILFLNAGHLVEYLKLIFEMCMIGLFLESIFIFRKVDTRRCEEKCAHFMNLYVHHLFFCFPTPKMG